MSDATIKAIYVRHMIMSTVCEMSHVRRDNLVSRDRDHHLAWSRHIAIYLISIATKRSNAAISHLFGGRDSSTIWHSIDMVKRHLVSSPELAMAVNAVRYCRERSGTQEQFDECLRRATSLLLDAYRRYIAERNAQWSERMRNKPPRPRAEGGKFA